MNVKPGPLTLTQLSIICLQQSLCSEMGEELRFALRCQGSRQRPTLRRSCVRCTPPSHTYVPTNHDVPHLHGVSYIICTLRSENNPCEQAFLSFGQQVFDLIKCQVLVPTIIIAMYDKYN